jgi:hypothetical protein
MINKNIIIIILILVMGFIFLYIDQYKRLTSQRQSEKIIYRYIPRTPHEEMKQEIFPSDIFQTMFTQPSPWINSVNDLDARKSAEINKYFVSQI